MKMKIFTTIFGVVLAAANVGGKDWRTSSGGGAADGQFPYQVSIQIKEKHVCGGSIISQNWVITDILCYRASSISTMTIVSGINKISAKGDRYNIDKVICDDNPTDNSITLFKTTVPIKFCKRVQPIKLNTEPSISIGETLVLSGWGFSGISEQPSDELHYLQAKYISAYDCFKVQNNRMLENLMCVFPAKAERNCVSDIGGPLVYKDKLAGVSVINFCIAPNNNPIMFSSVSNSITWIKEMMATN